jgi:hypothetical protein
LNAVSTYTDILLGATQVLEGNWREGRTPAGLSYGYTCPDAQKYPDQFFWDSCFHALVWSRIDPARAMRELRSLAAAQQPSGLIGHTTFWTGPARPSRAFTYNLLHRHAFSTSTIQPPLLGWVWAEVAERAGDAAFAEDGRGPTGMAFWAFCSPTSPASMRRRRTTSRSAGAVIPRSGFSPCARSISGAASSTDASWRTEAFMPPTSW